MADATLYDDRATTSHIAPAPVGEVHALDEDRFETLLRRCEALAAGRKSRPVQPYLLDLIRAIRPHPRGLRRWSVMRVIRKNRDRANLPIPHKIEDDVERAFLQCCLDAEAFKKRERAPETALFFRPQETAGEVWALYPERVEAWLQAELHEAG